LELKDEVESIAEEDVGGYVELGMYGQAIELARKYGLKQMEKEIKRLSEVAIV